MLLTRAWSACTSPWGIPSMNALSGRCHRVVGPDFDSGIERQHNGPPLGRVEHVRADQKQRGGVKRQGGGAHRAGVRCRAGGRGDQYTVGNELLDSLEIVDQQLEPGGLAGCPLDPGVVERQRTGAPTIERLDLDPQAAAGDRAPGLARWDRPAANR